MGAIMKVLPFYTLCPIFGTLANSADPDQDAAEGGFWSGYSLFANMNFYQK